MEGDRVTVPMEVDRVDPRRAPGPVERLRGHLPSDAGQPVLDGTCAGPQPRWHRQVGATAPLRVRGRVRSSTVPTRPATRPDDPTSLLAVTRPGPDKDQGLGRYGQPGSAVR